ncbi:hypothetical protein ACFL0V_06230 [Nanoarchaeota archaeon]
MECVKCGNKARFMVVDKKVCKKCFIQLVERRIKREFKAYEVEKGARVLVRDRACEYILSDVVKLPLNIVKGGKYDHKCLAWTMDDEIEWFLKKMFEGRQKKKEKGIRLFAQVSSEELKDYFRIKGIDYCVERSEVNLMIDELTKKYPQIKNSILNSKERIEGL